jgi:hypothetical protein
MITSPQQASSLSFRWTFKKILRPANRI